MEHVQLARTLAISLSFSAAPAPRREPELEDTGSGELHISELAQACNLHSLPMELQEKVLLSCGGRQLAALETTCRYFLRADLVEKAARTQLAKHSWARGCSPGKGEIWASLLHYAAAVKEADTQATAISLGAYHSTVIFTSPGGIRHDHVLATFGRGFHGQLGQGSYQDAMLPQSHLANSPVLIGGLSEQHSVIERPAVVACGKEHTAVIAGRGQLFTWGLSANGQLGRAEGYGDSLPATVFQAPGPFVWVCAGATHTLAINKYGELYACGKNHRGQLGVCNRFENLHQMRAVDMGGGQVCSVAAGDAHSVAVGMEGTVWTWGQARNGQTGAEDIALFLDTHPLLHVTNPLLLPCPRRLAYFDPHRRLPVHRIASVAAGGNATMFRAAGGGLLACGENRYGGLGLGDCVRRTVPTQVDLSHLHGDSTAPVRVVQVVCGKFHTLILVHCGGSTIVCATGYNVFGQLGLRDQVDRARFTPVSALHGKRIAALACGDNHSAAVSRSGEVWLWGRGDCGQLGHGDDRSRNVPTRLDGPPMVHPNITLRHCDPPPPSPPRRRTRKAATGYPFPPAKGCEP